jgi:hypothetical protein
MRINSYWATVRLRWLLFRSQKTTNQLRMEIVLEYFKYFSFDSNISVWSGT